MIHRCDTPISTYFLLMMTFVQEVYSSGNKYSKTIESMVRTSFSQISVLLSDLIIKEAPKLLPDLFKDSSDFVHKEYEFVVLREIFNDLFSTISIDEWSKMKTEGYHEAIFETSRNGPDGVVDFTRLLINDHENEHVKSEDDLSRSHMIKIIDELMLRENFVIGSVIPIDDESLGKAIEPGRYKSFDSEDPALVFVRKLLKRNFDENQ